MVFKIQGFLRENLHTITFTIFGVQSDGFWETCSRNHQHNQTVEHFQSPPKYFPLSHPTTPSLWQPRIWLPKFLPFPECHRNRITVGSLWVRPLPLSIMSVSTACSCLFPGNTLLYHRLWHRFELQLLWVGLSIFKYGQISSLWTGCSSFCPVFYWVSDLIFWELLVV